MWVERLDEPVPGGLARAELMAAVTELTDAAASGTLTLSQSACCRRR